MEKLEVKDSRSTKNTSPSQQQIEEQVLVMNDDKREPNTKSEVYPYNCIGLLRMFLRQKGKITKKSMGTGFLISPILVLTAAHNIFTSALDEMSEFFFYPGFKSEELDSFEADQFKVKVVRYKYCQAYIKKKRNKQACISEDYALLLLEKKVDRSEYIHLGYDFNYKTVAELFGYPYDKCVEEQLFQQYGAKGEIVKIQDGAISYNIDTNGGQSGSPLLLEFAQGFDFAVGIHSRYNKQENVNRACQLTKEKIDNLHSWAAELLNEPSPIIAVKINQIKLPKLQAPQSFVPLSMKIEEMQKKLVEEGSLKMRNHLYHLGDKCYHNGEYLKAIGYLEKALRLHRKRDPQNSWWEGSICTTLGLCHKELKQYDIALKYHQIDLEISKKEEGEESVNVASALSNIGGVYDQQGDSEKALEYYSQSLKIRRKVLGNDHEYVASSLGNIATIQQDKGEYKKAEEGYLEALRIKQKVFGKVHASVALTCYNLAGCYFYMRRYSEGLKYFFNNFQIMQTLQLTQHPNYDIELKSFRISVRKMMKDGDTRGEDLLEAIKVTTELFGEREEELLGELKSKLKTMK